MIKPKTIYFAMKWWAYEAAIANRNKYMLRKLKSEFFEEYWCILFKSQTLTPMPVDYPWVVLAKTKDDVKASDPFSVREAWNAIRLVTEK